MTDLIRSAGLSCYPEVARSVGLDPRQMMRKVRLPLAILDKPDTPIAVPALRRLLEISAAESGAEDFGLRLAERGGLTNFGAVGLIVREQATVGEAIEAFSRFIHVHHDGMKLEIVRDRQTVTIILHLRGRQPTAPRQSIDMALGSVHRIIQSLFGSDWRPQEVHLHYPPPHDPKRYRDFFGCRVSFNAEEDAVLMSAHDMERRIPSAHPLIASYLRKRIEAIENRPAGWEEKVDEVVRSLLASGDCTVERVAEYLACTRRTIHRHLAASGTSFSAILDAQRADLVIQLIEDPGRPLADIATQLGFSAQSAMARWFRNHFGCTITEWRRGVRPLPKAAADAPSASAA
ncbi:AraC family transcriptional regulator [Bradyrhizobium guangzhouense]|uniref:AraC family transcriptional regulator n=1 Tax=Bradyrhizobium guangzhouense TaxID=1325095 RepID=A0AAE5WY75_9BRAD|nr:AraC family transcriptional regulator [Bradyrhizobium guangzhouense]QAU45153.1 AraC family transcriptional regulator [Bradyrhizobium guangzhouense]RXH09947.1 AraC family transcriptional regulator [Bradyrhizobium guangzhouense]RXH16359.1 AraC family transcriptional regulator [Bradyrhizobium guangzhouense]